MKGLGSWELKKKRQQQLKKLKILKQILLVSILGNVWRICILMLGCEELMVHV